MGSVPIEGTTLCIVSYVHSQLGRWACICSSLIRHRRAQTSPLAENQVMDRGTSQDARTVSAPKSFPRLIFLSLFSRANWPQEIPSQSLAVPHCSLAGHGFPGNIGIFPEPQPQIHCSVPSCEPGRWGYELPGPRLLRATESEGTEPGLGPSCLLLPSPPPSEKPLL